MYRDLLKGTVVVTAREEEMTDQSGAIRNLAERKTAPTAGYLTSLRTQAWRTSGARYNGARRLKKRELFSTVSLAMFSALSVAVAFIQRIYAAQPGTQLDNYLTTLSACLGLFLLAISLMEWGASNGAKADALHRNAEELNAFQRKLEQRLVQVESGEPFGWSEVEKLREEYELIKERCAHNHSALDDLFFRASHRSAPEFSNKDGTQQLSKWGTFLAGAKWHLSSIWYFTVFWIIIVIVVVLAFWFK
jgi:outer membrane murein-binding lipoprotein Lpp